MNGCILERDKAKNASSGHKTRAYFYNNHPGNKHKTNVYIKVEIFTPNLFETALDFLSLLYHNSNKEEGATVQMMEENKASSKQEQHICVVCGKELKPHEWHLQECERCLAATHE